MPDSRLTSHLPGPTRGSFRSQPPYTDQAGLLTLVFMAQAFLLLAGDVVPGFFQPFDWWLGGLTLLVTLALIIARSQRWLTDAVVLLAVMVSQGVFLVLKFLYALFWVGTPQRILTELGTTTFWLLVIPVLLVSLRGGRSAQTAAQLISVGLGLGALVFLLRSPADARVGFSLLELALAGALVWLAARRFQNSQTRLEGAQQENYTLSRLAFFDDLTGLNNRTFLDQRLQELCQSGEPLAVLFADLDGFKVINDSLGHAAGDEVLCILATRLKEMGHATACLARVSGDEFVAVLQGRGRQEISTFAEWLVRELSRPIVLQGQELRLSASVGISEYPGDAAQAHDLLLYADRAMYAVKRSGKNGHRYYGDHLLEIDEPRHLIEQELRQARERGELSVQFQPICDMDNGSPHTIEVLMRWNNPVLGQVRPDIFIPIAEENGLITQLGEWVLSSALAAAQVWQAEGFTHLRVAVNVSPRQLMQAGFVEMVEATLENYDLPPSILELEVTEGVDLHERAQVMHCLQHLRQLGVIISLDDFGTGFASLSRLNELPVQVVKIDRVFVTDLTGNLNEERTRYVRTLISAMVGVASSLNLSLVVEGVETAEQREQLLALGCRQAQGYLFAHPMTEDELRGRLWTDDWRINPQGQSDLAFLPK